MATYNIKVLNSSGFAKSYVIFQEPPVITSEGSQPKVYTNAWVTFGNVLPGSFDNVQYTDVTFAYWASTQLPVAPGTVVYQGGNAQVDIASRDSVTFFGDTSNDQAIGFGPVSHGGAISGSYRIIANSDFTASNGFLFGLARPGNVPGVPTAAATFLAEPNDTFNITPVVKFYVADGAYVPGQIIDYTKVSTKAGPINFTGKTQTHAVVTQGQYGDFAVEYY
jgi:hypothetical protein